MAEMVIEEEQPSFFERLRAHFHKGEEEAPRYERKIMDGRIERFLDENFNNYIEEYGLVTELDIRTYEERYDELVGRVKSLTEFSQDLDAEVTDLERRMKAIQAKAKETEKAKKIVAK